jgi:hypothetical protein
MKMYIDDTRGCQQLINAVIARALLDSFRAPQADGKMDSHAKTAFDFLLGDTVDVWLELIDIDPGAYKKRLVDSVYSDKASFEDFQKRTFRINHQKWHQLKNSSLLKTMGYKAKSK